jgi:hypothetical protein
VAPPAIPPTIQIVSVVAVPLMYREVVYTVAVSRQVQ